MNYANQIGYTDITPYEVVRIVSEKCIEVRAMRYERDTSVKLDFKVGGFSAHCANQDNQKWIITSAPGNDIIKIRANKNGWADKWGNRYKLADAPCRFYDYNF
jgi:hypothetical protein